MYMYQQIPLRQMNEHEHKHTSHTTVYIVYLPVMKVDAEHQLQSTHYRGTYRYALKLFDSGQCV